MEKIRIAFFIDILREHMDGVANTSFRIISRLDQMGIEPIFFTCLPPENEDFSYEVFACSYVKIPFSEEYPFAIPGKKKKIFKKLDEFKPDLIHWSSPSLLGRYATRYSKLRNVPNITIYHSHFSTYVDYMKWVPFKSLMRKFVDSSLNKLYEKATKVLAPTLSMKEFLVERGLSEQKIAIWGRGIDGEKFSPNHRSEKLIKSWNAENKTKIIFVSRLFHYKETDMLIRLSHILRDDTVLIITGEGPEREKMERESNGAKTIFTGKLVGKELSEVYASSDIFVFPSLTDTFGNVVLEAMASGLPVIAANEGGPKNIVKDGVNGYLMEPKKEDKFNEKINNLIDDHRLYDELRSNALEYARELNWDNIVGQLNERYRSLISK